MNQSSQQDQHPPGLDERAISDISRCLLRETLSVLRHRSSLDFPIETWEDNQSLTEAPLGLDSLELMTAAGHVNRLFALDETGLEDYLLKRRTLQDWTNLVTQALGAGGNGQIGTSGLRFMSSGSTGRPTEHAHSWQHLWREVDHLAASLEGRKRIICTVPRHHVYGCLFGALLPQRLGIPCLVEHDAERALSGGLLPGDLIIAFPLRWQYILASTSQFPTDIEGVTSTGPIDSNTWKGLTHLGLSRLWEIYGATETAGIGMRHSPEDPFSLFPWWKREGETLLDRHTTTGEEKKYTLPDRLEWFGISEWLFLPRGRKDGAIQVGGINVSPDHVAAKIAQHPSVTEAVVRPDRQGRLKAFIVSRQAQIDEDQFMEWIRQTLPAVERPTSIRTGPALPRNSMGKLEDWH